MRDSIEARLNRVADHFSQAEIARKADIPQPSLSRYLRGQRIPVDVCVRVIEAFSINASWLLTGSGPMFSHEHLGSQVENISRITEALASAIDAGEALHTSCEKPKEHLQEISTRLTDVLEQRARIDEALEPVIAFVEQSINAGRKGAGWLPSSYSQLCELIADVVQDENLRRRALDKAGHLESSEGNPERGLEIRKRVFMRSLSLDPQEQDKHFMALHNFIMSLKAAGDLNQARRAASAVLELNSNHQDHEGYWHVSFVLGSIELELGELARARARLSEALPRIEEPLRSFHQGYLITSLLYSGELPLASAIAAELPRIKDLVLHYKQASACRLLWFVVAFESKEGLGPLRRLLRGYHPDFADHLGRYLEEYADVIQSTHHRSDQAQSYLEEQLATSAARYPLHEFHILVLGSQLARLNGEQSRAHVCRADKLLETMKPATPRLLLRYMHYRNVVCTIDRATRSTTERGMRRRAVDFFACCAQGGYRGLSVLDE